MYEKLQKSNFSERIVDEIKTMIIGKKLGPGERLPPERELAERFGVSRASIREAIRSLATLGLVESRTGDGTYVKVNLSDSILQPLSWAVHLSEGTERDLHEARKILEPAIAALAAQRSTPADRAQMLTHMLGMESALGNPLAVAEEDCAFHIALAVAAHNRILQETMAGMQRLLEGLIASRLAETREQQSLCYQEHVEIYAAVEAGDAARAYDATLRSVSRPVTLHDDVAS